MQEIFSWKFPFWNFQLQDKTTTKKTYKIVFHILALQSWSTIRWSMVIHQNITSFRLLQHTLFQIGFKTFLFMHADLYFSFENKSTRHPIMCCILKTILWRKMMFHLCSFQESFPMKSSTVFVQRNWSLQWNQGTQRTMLSCWESFQLSWISSRMFQRLKRQSIR